MTEPGKDLVVQNSTAYGRSSLSERERYVILLAKAGDLLPPNLQAGMVRDEKTGQMVKQGSVGKTFLLAETGDMLGIHPIAAMTGVHIIDGKPSISANLMSGLVRTAGHRLRVKVTGSVENESLTATAQLIRKDDPDYTFEVTWTVADAKRALLWPGKAGSNWQKYPKAMMKSRVISEITREGASDVLMGGNVYTPEELGVAVDEQGEPVELQQVPDDVSRETPRRDGAGFEGAEPKPETPIVDDRPAADESFDWSKAIRDVASREEAKDLYQKAKTEGVLNAEIKVGRKKRILGEVIIEIGKAMAEAEAAAPAEEAIVESEVVDEGAPAVLSDDPNVVDAEVVDGSEGN